MTGERAATTQPAGAVRKRGGDGVGLRDVARAAGVSTATVSRAINAPDLVSAALRERITLAIDRLGWVPDGAAKALATRRSFAIGAVFPTLATGDFARAAAAVQKELQGFGYTLLLACSEYDAEQELAQVRKFVERGVDGLILVGRSHHEKLAAFLDRKAIPYVFSFVHDGLEGGVCIGPDNRKAMAALTNYLLELGHRTIAVIAQSTDNNDRARARLEGIRDALAVRGLAVRPQHMVTGRWTIEEGRELFRRLWATTPRPTAIICGNAHLAVGAIIESQASGVAVPADVSIVSYDDIDIMSHLPATVTALRVPGEDIGRNAARWLVGQVEGRELPVQFEHMPELLARDSSGPPRRDADSP
ncbi:MAG: LacI family DNA-binding transcriptional regulator [Methylobacteriaceae bacterium]|nr:LacI family DNA-binding transcriptional regulator [Methylobacteriaceae bacterium]